MKPVFSFEIKSFCQPNSFGKSGLTRKIVFINRYFYPDLSATSQMLSDLVFELKAARQDRPCYVVTSRMRYDDASIELPKYEKIQGIKVYRVWTSRFGRSNLVGRAIDYATFYISAFIRLLMLLNRGDIVVAKTDPPLISVVAAVAANLKSANLVNWMQDMFPEVAVVLGMKLPGFVNRTAVLLRDWSLRQAKTNVVLGHIMAEKVIATGVEPVRVTIIANWSNGEEISPLEKNENELVEAWGLQGKFIVEYSGNLGRAHEFETILSAAEMLKDDDQVVFLFVGGGALYEQLKEKVQKLSLNNFVFKSYQPQVMLPKSLSLGDVHLISLQPQLEGLIVPSKFYGILAAGRPSIFIGDTGGELAGVINNSQCGYVVRSGDGSALAAAITSLKGDATGSAALGNNARKLYEDELNRKESINKWRHLIAQELNVDAR